MILNIRFVIKINPLNLILKSISETVFVYGMFLTFESSVLKIFGLAYQIKGITKETDTSFMKTLKNLFSSLHISYDLNA